MPQRVIATLTGGQVLITEFPDREQAESELRRIERFRQGSPDLPEIYWETIDGQRWCLSAGDFARPPALLEPAEVR